jgi:hypothetical protein
MLIFIIIFLQCSLLAATGSGHKSQLQVRATSADKRSAEQPEIPSVMDVEEEPSGARGSADSERPVSEKDKEDFAGASGAARSVGAPAAEFGCDFCPTIYAWHSDIARVEVHGDELRFHKRSDTTRTLQAFNLAA